MGQATHAPTVERITCKVSIYILLGYRTIDPEQCFQRFINTDAPAEILVVPHVIHHALALLVLEHIVVLLVDTQAPSTVTCREHSQCFSFNNSGLVSL